MVPTASTAAPLVAARSFNVARLFGIAMYGRRFGRFFCDCFAQERRRLNAIRFGPGQLLAHRETAAAMPALVGIHAATRPVHAWKRLALILCNG
jgi:hypothetical protein